MKETQKGAPKGWHCYSPVQDEYEAGLDRTEKHSGSQSAYLKSTVKDPKPFGNLSQSFAADQFLGKRMKMSAWVRSKLKKGTSQLWLRIDGDWKSSSAKGGCFDNMDDRPIKGSTDWTQYDLVVDVPKKSTTIVFGLMLLGAGQVWLDDVTFDAVSTEVPLTGSYAGAGGRKNPVNLTFEEAE